MILTYKTVRKLIKSGAEKMPYKIQGFIAGLVLFGVCDNVGY